MNNGAPLVSHLAELRRRLLYSFGVLALAFAASFYFARPIFNILIRPLAQLWADVPERRMIFTALHEQFFTEIRIAFFTALMVAFPVIASQIWIFVAPGLYRKEKRAFLPFLVMTPLLFIAGACFVYFLVIPLAWRFFAGFEQIAGNGQLAIQLEPKVNEYLSLVMRLIFAFGLCFELPVLLSLLVRAGMVSTRSLARGRRYAILLAFVVAAILTPPDPLSQIGLAIPIILLYEISILFGKLIERARAVHSSQPKESKEHRESQT